MFLVHVIPCDMLVYFLCFHFRPVFNNQRPDAVTPPFQELVEYISNRWIENTPPPRLVGTDSFHYDVDHIFKKFDNSHEACVIELYIYDHTQV